MRFNKSLKQSNYDYNHLSFVGKLVYTRDNDENNEDNVLLPIDALRVDSRSRITLTNKIKDILPVKPKDSINLYYDRVNSDIVLKVKRGSKVIDTFKITKERVSIIQRDLHSSLDKIKELSTPQYYYLDSPHKRYLPNIVLIDDDSDILLVFQSYLSSEGFNIQIFSKSEEALKYLMSRSLEHTVLITDIRMPGLNGIKLYQMLKSVNKTMKVIFVSALEATAEILSLFPEVKERDIIKKPIERDQFVSKVKAAIFDKPISNF